MKGIHAISAILCLVLTIHPVESHALYKKISFPVERIRSPFGSPFKSPFNSTWGKRDADDCPRLVDEMTCYLEVLGEYQNLVATVGEADEDDLKNRFKEFYNRRSTKDCVGTFDRALR